MRDNLERVNIVLTKEQHARFKEYSIRYHGSLSQFLRLAAESELDRSEKLEIIYVQPVLKRLDQLVSSQDRMNEILTKNISNMLKTSKNARKKIADDILNLLLGIDKLIGVPEMVEYLPYNQDEIIDGLEELIDTYSIKEIPQPNAPSKWQLIGDTE
jgi:hypothetical protein